MVMRRTIKGWADFSPTTGSSQAMMRLFSLGLLLISWWSPPGLLLPSSSSSSRSPSVVVQAWVLQGPPRPARRSWAWTPRPSSVSSLAPPHDPHSTRHRATPWSPTTLAAAAFYNKLIHNNNNNNKGNPEEASALFVNGDGRTHHPKQQQPPSPTPPSSSSFPLSTTTPTSSLSHAVEMPDPAMNNMTTLNDQEVLPSAPPLSYQKYLTMQEKRVVVTIRYSGDAGLKPYFLTVAKKLKDVHPDVVIERRILPAVEDNDPDDEATFEILVDGRVVVGKGKARKQKVARVDMSSARSVYVSMEELGQQITRARRRRRPSTAYQGEASTESNRSSRAGMAPTPLDRLRKKGDSSGDGSTTQYS